MHNILTDPTVRFDRFGGERETASLPEVYAALMADQVEAFPALRPHQRHAWHAFLVQLGAVAMERADLAEPPGSAGEWKAVIRALTPGCPDDEPWRLVVDDITKPAFMQPPARSKERAADFKPVATPDELDMLVTSRNHDLKSAVADEAQPDDWVFALITLQTMEGFGGAGNYGISRMNGGLGNRPAFSLAPRIGGVGAHVRRDLAALRDHLPKMFDESLEFAEDGHALLWTAPWDGAASEALRLWEFHPLYIEVCRRVRLCRGADGRLAALRATSNAARIAAKELKGRTGDPWTPADTRRDGAPLTLANGGFTYKRLSEYLTSGKWRLPALMRPTPAEQRSDEPVRMVARAMVRGQGKTEGYYERSFIVRHRFKMAMLGQRQSQDLGVLGEIAQKRIDHVGAVQRILSHAIQAFLTGGAVDKASPEDRNRARPWLNRLDEIVDSRFFEGLQDEFEKDDANEREAVHNAWLMNGRDGVVDHARAMLSDATDSLPCPAIHRYKARVGAEGLFEGRIRGAKGLPFLFNGASEEVNE